MSAYLNGEPIEAQVRLVDATQGLSGARVVWHRSRFPGGRKRFAIASQIWYNRSRIGQNPTQSRTGGSFLPA
jgi:hypothetical protein